jgi:hypothetical protein
MVIGFATSCMNRRWQLEQTLGPNLAALADTPHFIALCDYNSADAVGTLVEEFAADVRRGRLLYFRTEEPQSFHMSSGKNTAHRLALRQKPDVLFNLDADNRITPATIALLEGVFDADRDSCVHNWDLEWTSGTCGRVALGAARWQELGGYDEALLPVGWQDLDLMYRARAIGLHYVPLHEGVGPALANSYAQKVANIALPDEVEGPTARDSYQRAVAANMITSLGRPVRLKMEEQRRFSGVIDFVTPATI